MPAGIRLHLVALAALIAAVPLSAQQLSRDWAPEDRVVLRDFSWITALAAGLDRVYVASPGSLAIWHPAERQWDPPVTPPPGESLTGVFAALIDPLDNSVWLAAPDRWMHYQPELQLWQVGPVPEGIRQIAFDRRGLASGLSLLTREGWMTLPRGALSPMPGPPPTDPITPTTPSEALAANPTLQAFSSQSLLDNRLRQVRYTAAAESYDHQGWYLGTSGVGLLYLPTGSAFPSRIPFGLPGSVVGAVITSGDGVWTATDRTRDADAAVTYVSDDLVTFQTLRGPQAFGMPFDRANRLLLRGGTLWIASNAGVVRLDTTARGGDPRVIDIGSGLPDLRTYALLADSSWLVAGTAHGLARITDSLHARLIARDFADPAYALASRGDTLFVGTRFGVFFLVGDSTDLTLLPGLSRAASLQSPVVRLAWRGDTLVAMGQDRFMWRSPTDGEWTLGPDLSPLLGHLTDLAADERGFWVAGDRGVGFARLDTPPIRPLLAGDIPGPVTGLAVDRRYLWVGTTAGLVRFRLEAVRP